MRSGGHEIKQFANLHFRIVMMRTEESVEAVKSDDKFSVARVLKKRYKLWLGTSLATFVTSKRGNSTE